MISKAFHSSVMHCLATIKVVILVIDSKLYAIVISKLSWIILFPSIGPNDKLEIMDHIRSSSLGPELINLSYSLVFS